MSLSPSLHEGPDLLHASFGREQVDAVAIPLESHDLGVRHALAHCASVCLVRDEAAIAAEDERGCFDVGQTRSQVPVRDCLVHRIRDVLGRSVHLLDVPLTQSG